MGTLALLLSVPTGLTPLAIAAEPLGRPDVPSPRVSKVRTVSALGATKARERVAKNKTLNAKQAAQADSQHATHWPKASRSAGEISGKPGKDTVSLTVPRARRAAALGGKATPAAEGTATVNLLDQKTARRAGITGVVFTAAVDSPGQAEITVDYSSFADAIGGNWGSRLSIVSLPACALTRPQKRECRTHTAVPSRNNAMEQTVSAQATVPQKAAATNDTASAGVFAVTAAAAAPASSSGDYRATPLAASSSWEAGGSSGSFTWSYPVSVPPAAAGPAPSLSLSYDSGSIDGRTSNTNNQGSMLGEGFALTSSYIERKYGSCDDDGQDDKSDQCWKYENASLVLNGKSTELVKDDTTGAWRLKNDDASQVTHETGAANGDDGEDIAGGKGDGKGEYWKVTTGDGTVYTFGLNKLPGASTERTNSVWTVPVFGDDAGEPGHSSATSYSGRAKTQAWRWNLDLVTDVHGNASTYWYKAESNNYAKNGDKTKLAPYTRGGYLDEIKYGQRSDTLFTGNPSGKVAFTYSERCTASDCSSLTEDTADNWPDVPFDAICTATETDCLPTGPAFFTRKMLTGVNTSVWSRAAEPDAYKPVDSYTLAHAFLDGADIGNPSDKTLTLKSLRRTGKNGGTVTVPPVEFGYHMRPNRVDATDDILPLTRPRINTITTEAGAITTVTLSDPQCVRGSKMPAAEDDNNLSCYPVYWPVNGGDPQLDWFHKYSVTAVTTSDPAGQNEAVENSYTYENPGWHYNNDPFTPADERTWSSWRGYQKVTAYTGDTDHPQSKTVRLYMQGMHGDKRLDGTTRTATVTGIDVAGLNASDATDRDVYAGFLREEITYNATEPVSVAFHNIWYKQTASQQRSYANTKANFVRTARTYLNTYLPVSNTWRRSYTSHTYDATYGMVTRTESIGDMAKTGDETCTRTWYARNAAKGLTSLVSRARVVGTACLDSTAAVITDDELNLPADSKSRGDVLSDTAVVYDNATATGWSASQTPTRGLPRWSGRAKAYPAATGTSDRHPGINGGWQTTARTTYDTLSRPLTVTDAKGGVTSTAYYPAAAGPLTGSIVSAPKLASNAQIHKSYTYVDPARGSVTSTLDTNLKKTENTYDALGRLTATWAPNRTKGIDTPTAKYAYNFARGSQPWTSVGTIKADGENYQTSYAITDALLRPLQTQTASPLGGRVLTDTRYDSRGLAHETYADIYDNLKAPEGIYARASYAHTPALTRTSYDAAARPTTSTFTVFGEDRWSTTTSYTGDSTATTAVKGGNATRTITDALGRTTETRTYAGTAPNDTAYGATTGTPYTRVKAEETRDGKPSVITGIDDAKWKYTYDLFGRQTRMTDPDKGDSSTEYTDLDQVSLTTDSRNAKLLYEYDEIGRKTGLWQTEKTEGNKLAAWTYDTLVKGQPDASTRYVGGTTGKAYTKRITAYDTLNRASSIDLVLPADDPLVTSGAVSSILTFGTDYRLDGSINNTKEPGAGGLAKEIVSPKYNSTGLITELSGANLYLLGVTYSALGQPQQLTLGATDKKTYINNTYEDGTGRLTRSNVTDQTHPYMLQDLNFTQDDAGNVQSIFDPTTLGATTEADNQCFTYDAHRRLTEAWTPKTAGCATTGRTTANLDGAAPYWTSYTYNASGQRNTEKAHTATGDATTTYAYKTPTGQPHPLVKTTGAKAATYAYDATGNTTSRPGTQATQTLKWNTEGELASTTEPAAGAKPALGTTYLYDADGELLIRRATGDGDTVIYLGATEVRLTTKGTTKTITGTRYYSAAGQTIAVRTATTGTAGNKLNFLAADHHGTSSIATDATTQAVTKRYSTPFGAPRGTRTTTWPDDKAFLGKPADTTTGLTHIGAREYDPAVGQFISVDPLLELDKHQTLNGYSYSNNNPLTFSDPTGMRLACGGAGGAAEGCPTRPDGTKGNGRPNEAVQGGGGGGNRDSGTASIGGSGKAGNDNRYVVPKRMCEWHGNACVTPSSGEPDWGAALAVGMQIVLPDVDAWEECLGDHKLSGCGWAALDIPIFKVVKAGKVFIKSGKKSDGISNCKCFLAGTDVLMADGTSKDIEDVELGDKVQATDPETGETGPREVTRLIRTEDDKHFNELSIATEDGGEELTATHEHPFWSPSEHDWIEAGNLQPGMTLLTDDGDTVIVTANKAFTKHARTYNLTIDDLHTYYVLAGRTSVLVHNSNCDVPGSLQGQKFADQLRKESAGSPFTPGGFLDPDAIANSRLVMPGSDMGNKALRGRFEERGGVSQWGKYSTETHQSPYGDYQVHFYRNSTSGEVMYGMDYKVVMNRR